MKKITILALSLFSTYTFSQNLVITKRDYDSNSLLTLNSNTGEILNSTDYITDFSSYYNSAITSLSFNPQTNEIIRIEDNKIILKSTITDDETYIVLSEDYEYQGVITADNRLFVTAGNIIQEINPSNGDIIETHTLATNISAYNRNLTYSSTTKDIYGLPKDTSGFSYDVIFKFNIITNEETTLPLTGINHLDIVVAENRLFTSGTLLYQNEDGYYSYYVLHEIDVENGSIIDTYTYTGGVMGGINSSSYYGIRNLTYLADTQEICTMVSGVGYGARVVKYNINTNSESSFDLSVSENGDYYGYLISTVTEENLSMPELNQENQAKVIKAYNLLGQEVPIETYNQIIILKYDNGKTKKVYIKK